MNSQEPTESLPALAITFVLVVILSALSLWLAHAAFLQNIEWCIYTWFVLFGVSVGRLPENLKAYMPSWMPFLWLCTVPVAIVIIIFMLKGGWVVTASIYGVYCCFAMIAAIFIFNFRNQ